MPVRSRRKDWRGLATSAAIAVLELTGCTDGATPICGDGGAQCAPQPAPPLDGAGASPVEASEPDDGGQEDAGD
jgi:hypothetical protein